MNVIARLEVNTSKGVADIAEHLKSLNNEVVMLGKAICYVQHNGSFEQLKTAIKAAKQASKFTNSIKIMYGANQTSI